eukprot:gene18233-21814_t
MMALIQPSLDLENMVVRAPNMSDLIVPIERSSGEEKTVDVEIWKSKVTAYDCGDEAAEWFTKFLETDCRLVQVSKDTIYHRRVEEVMTAKIIPNPKPTDDEYDRYQTAFCDSSQVMILSKASIDDLNLRIEETRRSHKEISQKAMDVRRFRPNILLLGTDAYEEDEWAALRIGGVVFKKVNLTSRCKLTTVDPDNGIMDPYNDGEPLRTLKTFRETNKQVMNVI